jgi:hypothetical protein
MNTAQVLVHSVSLKLKELLPKSADSEKKGNKRAKLSSLSICESLALGRIIS